VVGDGYLGKLKVDLKKGRWKKWGWKIVQIYTEMMTSNAVSTSERGILRHVQ
jgi:hypothetical protein